METEKTCPLCGIGKIKSKHKDKISHIKELVAKGLTYRQIMKVMGFKSTSTVSYYLK